MPIAGRTAWTGAHAADGSRGRWQACSVDAVRGGWAKKPRPTAAQRQRASTRPVPTPAGCVRWEGRGGARTGSRGRLSPRGVVRALGRRVELTQHVGSAPASRHDRTQPTKRAGGARPARHRTRTRVSSICGNRFTPVRARPARPPEYSRTRVTIATREASTAAWRPARGARNGPYADDWSAIQPRSAKSEP